MKVSGFKQSHTFNKKAKSDKPGIPQMQRTSQVYFRLSDDVTGTRVAVLHLARNDH